MGSIRDEVSAVLDRLDGDLDELTGLELAELTTPERFAVLERVERVRRRLPVPEHAFPSPPRPTTATRLPGPAFQCRSGE